MTVLRSSLISIAVGLAWIAFAVVQLPYPSFVTQLVTVLPATLAFVFLPRALRAAFGPDGWWWTARRDREARERPAGPPER